MKDKKKVEEPKVSLTHKVINLGDYYIKAKETLGATNFVDNAIAIIYSENDIVAKIEIKGAVKFIAKI